MVKILKFISIMLVSLILLLLIGVGLLAVFVSPNKLKPVITQQVFKYTGRQLIIDGDLSWTVYPTLAVKINHASLSNPVEFKDKKFAEIDHATAGVKLMPLFHSSIEFTNIVLSGLKLNLIVNADGKANWQISQPDNQTEVAPTVSAGKQSAFAIQIPSVDVSDANMTFNNLQTKQTAQIEKFNFHADNISPNRPFPISSTFNYNANNPAAMGQMTLKANLTLDTEKNIYSLNGLDVTIKTLAGNKKEVTANVTGDVIANLANQTVTVSRLVSRIANLTLNGNMNVTGLSANPELKGHLDIPAFDLKAFLQALGCDQPALQSAKNVAANFDFATVSKTEAPVQAIQMQGNIKMAELQAAKLKASNINITANLKNGILDLTSITAAFYQGTLQSQAKINLVSSVPQISFQSRLANVQAEPLLQDLDSQNAKLKVKGAGNIDVEATTSGSSADDITHHLNGKSTFSFQNGVLDGINIGYWIDSANAFLKGQSAPAAGQNLTNFGNLTGTAAINSGVITNNDLSVISPRFDTKGQGTINLVTQQIDYSLQIKPKVSGDSGAVININELVIPVNVTGSLNNPSIKLNGGMLAQSVAKQKLKQVQDKVTDQIKNKIPGQAGALLQNFLGR